MEIEASRDGASGRLSYRFNANGFGPNCDPNQKPAFDVRHPRAVPPDAVVPVAERRPAGSPPPPGNAPGWQPKR